MKSEIKPKLSELLLIALGSLIWVNRPFKKRSLDISSRLNSFVLECYAKRLTPLSCLNVKHESTKATNNWNWMEIASLCLSED